MSTCKAWYLKQSGTPRGAPHVLAGYVLFAASDLFSLFYAFARAERQRPGEVWAPLAAAYAIGGYQGGLDCVRALGIPGVRVGEHGMVEWVPPAQGAGP